jgi:alpha-1,3-rhamnosyl/mannosyltransferase
MESAVHGARRSLADMFAFTKATHRCKPDIFFCPTIYSYFPLPFGLRSVVCFHDTIAEDFPELIFSRSVERWAWHAKVWLALRQATRIMTVSESSRISLMRRFKLASSQVDVVTEGPSPLFTGEIGETACQATLDNLGLSDRPYLLFVGGISPHKNLLTLLDAMDLVLKRHDVQLVMVGDPLASGFLANRPELQVKIDASEALKSHCTFTGFVPDETLVALYSKAEALVFPSLGEGFGLPAVEAMSQGLPVLASNAGSIQEIVGDAGLYYPPLNAEEMARKINTFLSDPILQATLRDRSRRRIRKFTWERAADLAMESFERAVS